ncbi:unnamed protein product [Periconia digitata]|uniref:Zn(2)-C6 fungal-type domain-containing protein n=1 Tax=Periconia digitata TaxID=1303443 RepID=A0A9W4U1F4_9PLEO|nr:unnamed protein product [Periconia digitata]
MYSPIYDLGYALSNIIKSMSATPDRVIGASVSKQRNTTIACRNCHARKVKCSGGQPYSNCRRDRSGVDCSYPNRIRHIKLRESYVDELLSEINRLRRGQTDITENNDREAQEDRRKNLVASELSQGSPTTTGSVEVSTTNAPQTSDVGSNRANAASGAERNPLLDDRPWFISVTPEMPVLVGEATDAAFATRFRQALSGKTQRHFPRTQYSLNPITTSINLLSMHGPPPARARILTKVALKTICRRNHLVRKSTVLAILERSIQSPDQCDSISVCKLFVMFALGEVYSARATFPGAKFPGIDYYNHATNVFRVLSEEPRIECVEIMLMLSLYSTTMNRRHAAYCMVGCAMRFAILIGLHHNVPDTQLPDRVQVEHRVRLWWSVYMMDRSWATMLGQPVSIRDEEIGVALPSSHGIPEVFADDFQPVDDVIAGLHISRLSAEISSSIYGRSMQQQTFSHRVQQALQKLDDWVKSLPDSLRTKIDEASTHTDIADLTLHLYYNQCLMLATRPVLLHLFRLRHVTPTEDLHEDPAQPSEPTLALAEACVICARKTYHILINAWINGLFPTFDYALTQYLFSTCIVLAISSLLQARWLNTESEDFEAAVQILDQLSQNGSQAASEFMRHVDAIKSSMESQRASQSQGPHQTFSGSSAASQGLNATDNLAPRADAELNHIGFNLSEPSLQDLLSFPHWDLDSLENSSSQERFQSFYWPDGNGEHWTS